MDYDFDFPEEKPDSGKHFTPDQADEDKHMPESTVGDEQEASVDLETSEPSELEGEFVESLVQPGEICVIDTVKDDVIDKESEKTAAHGGKRLFKCTSQDGDLLKLKFWANEIKLV